MTIAPDTPRPGRPPSITRARIADAGIAMGLPAMTFTGVAALLGVSHVALYKHVAHLAALKLLVAAEIFARWQLPVPGEDDLEHYLLRFSASLRQLVKSHPGLAPYLLRRKATPPTMLARIEAHQAQVAHGYQLPLERARWLLSTVAFHCVALADTVYAPAGDAWEAEDDALIEAEFDLGMRALVIGVLTMRP
ncbi:TetR/AcrR family transcriptional regulator [Janthinobacterium lividum]|uniref:TetR/AcrR family transcriptional regulator n=1 Tax=Janthinobacterium lividum TaxID=29581 RepID=A0ABU0XL82_9BURK|nr:TetR/AcrR family transcriptional regulator [Janthinobacterium lividum]MDQ4624284.1 TetR/AcrR family transcriptional regulator [Janthinobacterium lividum]MDQ4674112.1 TetR/AcrR family transcriptional regulator [Janthinobacterium lividum]MDQ4684842.1 TetR/AcrR family transcriptional regulator [Janthinobacterium lividum]